MDNFDPQCFLAIATNIPQRLETGFVVQSHILFCFLLLRDEQGTTLLFKSLRLVRFVMFFKVYFAHQCCIYLIRSTNSNIVKYYYNLK